ncbi:MAG: dTDP-4-dehydrorhamnose 3,5-epimerase [Erysipelotrichaceae bacterium]
MNVVKTKIEGLLVIEPKVFGDHRGWFMESYNQEAFNAATNTNLIFVQDNQSFSAKKGTLRGLHYQLNPAAQTKLIRCTRGRIFDVAVDIRKNSPTYGEWFGLELSEENKKQLLIPQGFAHGFMTLEENCEVQYKVDCLYNQACDRGIRWNDPTINVKWSLDVEPVISAKDEVAPYFVDADNNFEVKQ